MKYPRFNPSGWEDIGIRELAFKSSVISFSSENAKKEKEEDLPDEELNEETEPKNSNVDSKENKAIPSTDFNNQNQLDKQNNSQTDENNSVNTNEQNEQENNENNQMNSLCDKISSTNEGFYFFLFF